MENVSLLNYNSADYRHKNYSQDQIVLMVLLIDFWKTDKAFPEKEQLQSTMTGTGKNSNKNAKGSAKRGVQWQYRSPVTVNFNGLLGSPVDGHVISYYQTIWGLHGSKEY